jgi:hypothetical protein
MPFVDLPSLAPSTPVTTPTGTAPQRAPDFFELSRAVFEQENMLVSAAAAEAIGVDRTPDPSFDAWQAIKGTKYETHWERFTEAHNIGIADALKRDIDREEENRSIIDAAPLWQSMPLILGASIADPTILLPGGAFLRTAKGGLSILRSTLNVGAATSAAVAVQEVGLHATQQTRTLGESTINISASALLGGLLGAGGSALLSRAEWMGAVRTLERDLREAPAVTREGVPAPLGAAAVVGPDLDALTIAGTAAGITARRTAFLNPGLRLMNSPDAGTRDLATRLFEMTQYLRANDDGVATPQSVETLRKEWNAGLQRAVDTSRGLYKAYRQRNGALTREQFSAEIGRAMRRGDEHPDPEIANAAKAWRNDVFDPALKAAQDVGLLPNDLTIETATSYFSRVYNRQRLILEEGAFKDVVSAWVTRSAPRWMQDFDIEAANKLAAAQDRVTNAGAAGRTEAERALRDLETEIRIERDARFGDAGAIDARAREVADEVFDKLTGRAGDSIRPDQITVDARGPLKARTFNIPDELIEPWLESDIDLVGRRYHRIMSSDVELARAFGQPDMRDQIVGIRERYAQRRSRANPEQRVALDAAERADVRDIEGVRDLLRGTYKLNEWERNFGRIARVANMFNYIRSMGQVVLASLPEAYRTAMVHGLQPTMATAMKALTSRDAFRMSVNEAKLAGNIGERALSHRLATLAEIGDFYTSRGPVEKFMANMTEVASTWNGIRIWTDWAKMVASVQTQHRVLEAAGAWARDGVNPTDRRYLAYLGIDQSMASRINAQFADHGEVADGVRVANTERWTDLQAVRAYRAAINKDIDTQIVTRSVADIPLFANTPLGRMLFQFNSFNLASHQRVLLRAMQEGPARLVSGVVAMTSIGMAIVYLRALAGNRLDTLPDFAENPGYWLSQGLDQSGLAALPMQLANASELLTGVNPIKAAFTAFDKTLAGSQRLRNRNLMSVLGPTAGLAQDVQAVTTIPARVAKGGDVTPAQRAAAERLLPFNSYVGMRQMLRYVVNAPD